MVSMMSMMSMMRVVSMVRTAVIVWARGRKGVSG
jgi:hypothetical protein